MIAFVTRLLARGEPILSEASARDAHGFAALHAPGDRPLAVQRLAPL